MAPTFHVGQRISFDSLLCTVRYVGPVASTQKEWLGVEWDDPTRGKHGGEHQGVKYFSCKDFASSQPKKSVLMLMQIIGRSSSKTAASFVRPSRATDPAQSFIEAVHQKYASGITERRNISIAESQIEISGKIVQEVGFDKIRQQLAQLHELKIVIVDGMRVALARTDDRRIQEVCPRIVELDLSRNLFEYCDEIMKICLELENLRVLRLK